MTQRRNGLIQHIRSTTVIDDRAGAFPQLRQEGHANARLPSIPKASASSFSSRASLSGRTEASKLEHPTRSRFIVAARLLGIRFLLLRLFGLFVFTLVVVRIPAFGLLHPPVALFLLPADFPNASFCHLLDPAPVGPRVAQSAFAVRSIVPWYARPWTDSGSRSRRFLRRHHGATKGGTVVGEFRGDATVGAVRGRP
jgi:hypothetical protein